MSTEAPQMSSIDNPDLADVMGRIRELEEIVEEQDERIDALEAENERLREEVEERPTVEYRGDSVLEDLWIGNNPVGQVLDQAEGRSKTLNKIVFGTRTPTSGEVEEVEEDGALVERVNEDVSSASSGLSDDVRKKLLPAHEMWMDIRADREDRIPGQSKRRAARLFGRFVQRASKNSQPNPVDASGQSYTLSSTDARDILAEAGDMSESGRSMTTKRAMQDVQRLTKTDDCDCSSVKECPHGLITFGKENGTNRLHVNKKQFNTAMENVEAAVEGGVGDEDIANDGSDARDETDDVADEFNKLESADIE